MLNYLWGAMIIISIITGTLNGRIGEVGTAAIESSKEAVTLCVTMLGVMSLWMGLMGIARSSGLIDKLTGLLSPALRFLFPNIPEEHPSRSYIASNLIANILGLGWAATPFGLKAMQSLSELHREQCVANGRLPSAASNEMCTFLILNISSLQLIPVNIIAYRSQYGSSNPAAVAGPAIAATVFSSVIAVLFCKVMDRKRRA